MVEAQRWNSRPLHAKARQNTAAKTRRIGERSARSKRIHHHLAQILSPRYPRWETRPGQQRRRYVTAFNYPLTRRSPSRAAESTADASVGTGSRPCPIIKLAVGFNIEHLELAKPHISQRSSGRTIGRISVRVIIFEMHGTARRS